MITSAAIITAISTILAWTPDHVRMDMYESGQLDGVVQYVEAHEAETGFFFVADDASIDVGDHDFFGPQP